LYSKFILKIAGLNRYSKRVIMMLSDSLLSIIILLSAFSIRLGYLYWPESNLIWLILGSPILAIPIFFSFKLYQSVIRYIGFKGFSSIAKAVSLYSAVWGLIGYMGLFEGIPRSVILINWMLSLIVISSSRVLARVIFNPYMNSNKKNIIIYGCGSSGMQLSNALQLSNDYSHVAFIDDDKKLHGSFVNGVPVFSSKNISELFEKYQIYEVLLALPSISILKKNKIIEKFDQYDLNVRNLPSVTMLAEGKVTINDLLEIDINDLLERDSIKANKQLLKVNILNKVVLVTGAGGSIGSELSRQIISLKPKRIILFDISEASLYLIEQELTNFAIHEVQITAVLGSVTNPNKLKNLLIKFNVQTIYHAAAYKHVPLVEFNQIEGIVNNTLGTLMTANAAIKASVETFVLISTDKAVRPTNTMGASKRAAELVLQALSKKKHNTCFTMVRFGNVLDSSGSVIPLFRNQIRKGGPVTVTDKNIVRYFMTIPEAVELVIQAGAMAKGGDVFILDMGNPVKIYDLAKKMISLSGLQVLNDENPEGDIEIKLTGLRPGEKLYEELLLSGDMLETENKLIMRAEEKMIGWDELNPILSELNQASLENDLELVITLIKKIVPEFEPKEINTSNTF
jgi:FlaA1/EpsC-like NDP-sugar epimerase